MLLEFLPAFGCALMWAGVNITSKMLATSVPATLFAFIRYFIAALCLLPFAQVSQYKQLTRRHIAVLLVMGLLMGLIYNLFFLTALQYTSVTTATLISATNPILTLFFTSLFYRSMPTRNQLLAFLLSFTGAALIITQGRVGFDVFTGGIGEFLMLGGVLIVVAYTLILRRISQHYTPIFLTLATSVSGVIFLLPLCANQETFEIVRNFSMREVGLFAYLGPLGTALGLALFSMAVKKLGAPLTSLIVFSLQSVFVFILAFFLLGDSISVWQASGGLLVLAALFLGLRKT